MAPMTPEEARALLDGTTPGPWEVRTSESGDTWLWAPVTDDVYGPRRPFEVVFYNTIKDVTLAAAAPTLAALAAGMREEWGVHVTGYPTNIADWAEICDSPADSIEWHADEEAAADFATEREDDGFNTRIVRRYVTEPEEA